MGGKDSRQESNLCTVSHQGLYIHPPIHTCTHALKLKAARVHVQGRVLYNQTYCKLSSSSLRTPHFQNIFQGVSPSAPLSSSNLVHFPLQSLYPPLFIGHQLCTVIYFFGFCCTFIHGSHNFIIEKVYRDTIKYHEYCLSHYRDSRKALIAQP